MTNLITKLSDELKKEFKTADEIWIAVALLNMSGLNIILKNRKPNSILNFLVGVDLPTEPKALIKLLELELKYNFKVHLYTNREYFHPKLYLFRNKELFKGYVGSANCTNGGLENNIELTISVENPTTCIQMKKWFEQLYNLGKPITMGFIIEYQKDYLEKNQRKRKEELLVTKEKKINNVEVTAIFKERSKLVKILKSYRKEKIYMTVEKERKITINDLKLSLDYPNFKNIDIDKYFSYYELGHLIAIPKPTIKSKIDEFRLMLLMLCDESISISQRYELAFNGKNKVLGVGDALISKVLVMHRPDLYYVKNGKIDKALKKYRIEFPNDLSIGDRYEITCKELRKLCQETNIDNLAVLDYYLYKEGND